MSTTVILYMRVSTEFQTVEPQRLELLNYCDRNGWSVAGEYVDVVSGATESREALDRMLGDIEGRRIGAEAVLVVKLDRLGRSILNVITLVNRLAKSQVAVICTSQGIDTRSSNPCGKMVLSIMAAFAEFERDIIRERTVAGLAAAKGRGVVLGRPSPRLVPNFDTVISQWYTGNGGVGLRLLAERLGGVSISTAHKLAVKYRPAGYVRPVERLGQIKPVYSEEEIARFAAKAVAPESAPDDVPPDCDVEGGQ